MDEMTVKKAKEILEKAHIADRDLSRYERDQQMRAIGYLQRNTELIAMVNNIKAAFLKAEEILDINE